MLCKAAVVHEKGGQYLIEQIEVADPKENEVMVKIAGCGLCHTDELGRMQNIPVKLPAVFGHEGSGVVYKVGKNVTRIKEGDHVVLSYSHCGECEHCLQGHPYVCSKDFQLNFGGLMRDGSTRLTQNGQNLSCFFGQSSFAEYAVTHESNVVVVNKEVDIKLLGPLGCGFETGAGTVLNGLKPEFGSSIAIFGVGSVSSSAIMAAKIANCQIIIAIGRNDEKLALAKEFGATHIINSKKVNDVVKAIQEITNGGANYTMDTTGVPEIMNQALYSLRTNGQCASVAVTGETTIDIFQALTLEGRTLKGYIQGNSIPRLFIPKLVDYYKAGLFPFDKLIKVYKMEDINKAFEDVRNGKTIKPVITMD